MITIGIRDKREVLGEFEYVTATFSWEDNMIQRGEGGGWENCGLSSRVSYCGQINQKSNGWWTMFAGMIMLYPDQVPIRHISRLQFPSYSQSIN